MKGFLQLNKPAGIHWKMEIVVVTDFWNNEIMIVEQIQLEK
jgi:hypothetical protein